MSFILTVEAAAAFDDLTRSGRDDELVDQKPFAWPANFRRAIAKEIHRFTEDLAEDLSREAEATQRPIAHVHHAAEAMVTVAFNLGASSIDLPREERLAVIERIIIEVRMIMRGAQADAAALH